MKNIFTTLLLSIILLTNGVAQQISVTDYNKAIIHEDFNTEGDFFPIVTTTDNYFILDRGDYLLSRNNEDSEYAIIASNSSVNDFVLKTAIRIGPSNKKASVGIILKAQQDGKRAIIFEINKKREYRIKQLLRNTYKTISGSSKDEGWVKNKNINGVDEHNFIEIRTENNLYDIYVNNDYLTTFLFSDYTRGSCGIIISPKTKVRIAYYYINTKDDYEQSAATYKNVNATIEELNKKIETLEKNNATLNNLSKKNANLATVTTVQEKEIASLQSSITDLKSNNSKIEELEKIISDNATLINKLNTEKNTFINDVAALTKTTTSLNTKNTELASATIEQEKERKTLSTTLTNLKNKNIKLANDLTELTNDLNKINKSSNNRITQLTTKINSLQAAKTTLTTDLTKEKNAHTKTKNRLSKSVTNKTTELNKLTAKLNNAKKQIESTKKTRKALKECTTNSINLLAELKQVNNELNILKLTQATHNDITTDLNTQVTDLNNRLDVLNNQLNTSNNDVTTLETTNFELKELFILKDFELNGVKPSEMVKQTSNKPAPKVLKNKKTFYTVQVGVFMQEQVNASIRNLDDVWYNTTENGTYVYYSGEFNSPQEVTAHKNSLMTLGYPNAFVVTLTK